MKTPHILFALAALFAFTGCTETVEGLLYDKQTETKTYNVAMVETSDGSIVPATDFAKTLTLDEDAIITERGPVKVSSFQGSTEGKEVVAAGTPITVYVLPEGSRKIAAGESVEVVTYTVDKGIQGAGDLAGSLGGPWGGLAGEAVVGILGIGAYFLNNRKKKTAEKVAGAALATIDTIRDIHDQTAEIAPEMDEKIRSVYKEHATKFEVLKDALSLFDRYETPDKPVGGVGKKSG